MVYNAENLDNRSPMKKDGPHRGWINWTDETKTKAEFVLDEYGDCIIQLITEAPSKEVIEIVNLKFRLNSEGRFQSCQDGSPTT